MQPMIDQAAFRKAITAAPEAVRNVLAARFTERGWPSLDPATNGWAPDELRPVAFELATLAAEHGWTLHVGLDTAPMAERIKALPIDLADLAAEEAAALADPIPNVGHPFRWTFGHWSECDRILSHAEELAAARLRHVHAALGQAGMRTDEERHALVGCITGGRTESSKALTGPEARYLAEWAEGVTLGVNDTHPAAYVPDWKAEAKRLGTTQGELLKAAKAWHKARRLEAPKTLAEVTDHRAIAALLTSAGDGRTMTTEAAEHVPATPPPEPETAELIEIPAEVLTPSVAEVAEAREELAAELEAAGTVLSATIESVDYPREVELVIDAVLRVRYARAELAEAERVLTEVMAQAVAIEPVGGGQ